MLASYQTRERALQALAILAGSPLSETQREQVIADTLRGAPDNGLPMGIQILGRNRAEFGCLRLAWAYEQASSWPRKRRPSALG